jgi:hypothetical protein
VTDGFAAHGRHVSLSLTPSSFPAQHAHADEEQQQQHAEDAARPSSRSARLCDLIKATPIVALPAGVRRAQPPRSLRELHRREAAARKEAEGQDDSTAAAASAVGEEADSVDGVLPSARRTSGSNKKSAVGRSGRPKFSKPSRLNNLEAQAELVDLDLIRSLERGFSALERFKALSREFDADARGKAATKRAGTGGATSVQRGVGAFARGPSRSQRQGQSQRRQPERPLCLAGTSIRGAAAAEAASRGRPIRIRAAETMRRRLRIRRRWRWRWRGVELGGEFESESESGGGAVLLRCSSALAVPSARAGR